MKKYDLVYFAHPVSGDVAINLVTARMLLEECIMLYYSQRIFIAPWMAEVEAFFDEAVSEEPSVYESALARCCAVVERCDELWLMGPQISGGMKREAAHAKLNGVKVNDFTCDNLPHPEGRRS